MDELEFEIKLLLVATLTTSPRI